MPPPASLSSELSLALPCSVLCYVVGDGEPTLAGGSLLDSTNGGLEGYTEEQRKGEGRAFLQPCPRWPLWLWLCLFCGSVSHCTGLLNILCITPGPGLGKHHPLSFSQPWGQVSASCYFFSGLPHCPLFLAVSLLVQSCPCI